MSDVGKTRSGKSLTAHGRWHGDPPADSAAARARLLNAAQGCFAKLGVARTTMDDIASRAGVHRSTVYEYFSTRDAVLAEVFGRETADVIWQAGKHLREQPDFGEGLVRAIAAGIELTHDSPQLGVLLLEPATAGNTVHAAMASEVWAEQVESALAEPLRQAVARGEVREDVPFEDLLAWIIRVALSVTTEPPCTPPERIRQTLRWFLLPALSPAH